MQIIKSAPGTEKDHAKVLAPHHEPVSTRFHNYNLAGPARSGSVCPVHFLTCPHLCRLPHAGPTRIWLLYRQELLAAIVPQMRLAHILPQHVLAATSLDLA